MTTQQIAPSHPADQIGYRRIRTAAASAGVAVLIATGGYLAITTIGPDAARPTPRPPAPTCAPVPRRCASCARASPASTAADPRPDVTVNPNTQVRLDMRKSIAGQYGPAR